MDRELKIVVSVFLLFFFFGLGSMYHSGGFIIPIFLNQLILLAVAVLFFIMNKSLKDSWILGVYIFIQTLACLVDGFTAGYLAQKLDTEFFFELYNSYGFGIFFLTVYFGFFVFLSIYSYLYHQQKLILLTFLTLLILTPILLLSTDNHVIRDVCFFAYLIFFVVVVQRFLKIDNQTLQVISYQFLLVVLLEGLEHFQ